MNNYGLCTAALLLMCKSVKPIQKEILNASVLLCAP